jgi:hypothetical protein
VRGAAEDRNEYYVRVCAATSKKRNCARCVCAWYIHTHTYVHTQGPGRRRQTTRAASRSRLHIRHGAAPFVRSVRQSSQPGRQAQPDRASTMCKPPLLQHCRFSLSLSLSLSLSAEPHMRERDDETSVRRFISKRSPSLFASHPKLPARAHTIHHRARGTAHARLSPQSRPISHFFYALLQISRPPPE